MENQLKEKLQKIKAVIFDIDGVFFTGRVFINPGKGELLKERSYIDGQGISLLRAIGIRIAFITGEKTGFIEMIGEKLNSLPSVKDGKWPKIDIYAGHIGSKKVDIAEQWLNKINVNWGECAFMGDDVADYKLLQKVGVAAAPAQAEEVVKKIVHYISTREGGKGAVRDFCNSVLEARGIDPTSLPIK